MRTETTTCLVSGTLITSLLLTALHKVTFVVADGGENGDHNQSGLMDTSDTTQDLFAASDISSPSRSISGLSQNLSGLSLGSTGDAQSRCIRRFVLKQLRLERRRSDIFDTEPSCSGEPSMCPLAKCCSECKKACICS